MRTFYVALSAAVFALSLSALPAWAVVVDESDLSISEAEPTGAYSSFDWDGIIQYGTSGGKTLTAVDQYWVLTSRHYTVSVGNTFTAGGATYTVQEVQNNPDNADLAMLRVDKALPVWYELYSGNIITAGANKTEVLMAGTGHSGDSIDNTSFTYYDGTIRQQRWGTNEIDSIATTELNSWGGTTDVLAAGFRLGDTLYEAGLADHDSGGGWFVNDNGTWKLVGVNVGLDSVDSPYNTSYAVDVRSYSDWIVNTVPEPATMSLLGLGGLALLVRRRRRRTA